MDLKLSKRSSITGVVHTMDIPALSIEALLFWERLPLSKRPYVQDAFPYLSADGREFILTGINPEEWDASVGDLDD